MMSWSVETVRGSCARGARWVGMFAIAACIAVGGGGSGIAQTSGKIPELTANPSSWAWVRIRADGRNALYGDGWLDPPAGLRGPIRNLPDYPMQGNTDRGAGRQVTRAFGNYGDPILK